MSKRDRKPKPQKPEFDVLDLQPDEALLLLRKEGVKLLLPASDDFNDLPAHAKFAWALWARLRHDPDWRNKLSAELAAWTHEVSKKQADQTAAAYAKERAASIMERASHAMH